MFSTCNVNPLRLSCSSIFFFQLIVSIRIHSLSVAIGLVWLIVKFFPFLESNKRLSTCMFGETLKRLVENGSGRPEIEAFERLARLPKRVTRRQE